MFGFIFNLFGIKRPRTKRIAIPSITLTIEGKAYETSNWSMSGFRLDKFRRDIAIGENLKGQIGPVRYSGGGGFNASVVRLTEDGGFGACWSDIDRDIYTAMSGFGG
jgi:hypothetical protein